MAANAKISVKNARCGICGTASVLNQDFSFLKKGMSLNVEPVRKSSKVETIYVQERRRAAGAKTVSLF
jgi:hypothetical protein